MNKTLHLRTSSTIHVLVKKHGDTFNAYPIGLDAVCVSQGVTAVAAIAELIAMLKSLSEVMPEVVQDCVDHQPLKVFLDQVEITLPCV